VDPGGLLPETDYGALDRLLHRVVLGSRFMGQIWFDIEHSRLSGKPALDIQAPIFIAGLARSGSTILLNALYSTGEFRSLTYRDMPFILMPGMWKQLAGSSRVQRQSRERAHGDRVMIDFDSPEAFEEVFWRTFHGNAYISDKCVIAHDVPVAVRDQFMDFVRHVLHSRDAPSQTRYLSKNNNNLLRLSSLRQTFVDAVVIIPFRDPVQQAISLLRQHKQFLEQHAIDRFSLQYMNWLGHYEFGLGHREYQYTGSANPYTPDTLDYWLQCWLSTYVHSLESASEGAIFLNYEKMCAAPRDAFEALYPLIGLKGDPAIPAGFYQAGGVHDVPDCNEQLLERCRDIYDGMSLRHPVNASGS